MINRFDTSIDKPYVSNRIELPFQELNAIAKNQQKSFDEGRAIEDDLGALGAAIKSAPMYEADRSRFINEYKNKIAELTGNGNVNYADPNFKRKASNLVNEFRNRPEINAYANTLKSYQDWESQAKNPDNARNLDFTYGKDNEGNFNQLDVLKQGVYSPKFTKYADYDEATKKVMGTIAKDSKAWEGKYDLTNTQSGNNGETLVYNRSTGSYEGVDVNKLKSLANTVLPNYRSTDAGKHQMESILRDEIGMGNDSYNASYSDLEYKASKGDVKSKQIKDYLDNRMLNTVIAGNAHQVGVNTKQGLDSHFDTDAGQAAANRKKEAEVKPVEPINPWNMLSGQANPEPDALNGVLSSIKSGFKFNNKGELEENVSASTAFTKKNVNTYVNKATGEKFDLNNLPSGWKVKTNKANKEQGYDIIVNNKGEEINLTNKAYSNEFSHDFGTSKTGSYQPSKEYTQQQHEILSFLHNTNQFDSKKSAQDNYKSGIKLYGDAIKAGKLNSMSTPEFDAVTAKAFEEYYLPKYKYDDNGNSILTDAGRTNQWNIEGIDKGTEDGMQEFQNIVAGANIVGPDLIKGGSHVLLNTKDGRTVSVNLNSKTMEANFEELSNFSKKNNESIYKADKVQSHKDFMDATLTTKKHQSTIDNMQNEMINLTLQHSPDDINNVTNQLKDDNLVINNLAGDLLKNKYSALNTYFDKQSNTLALSFINREDPNNPDIQVIEYQPGAQPTMVSNAVFNRDMYQKLFGNFAANTSEKTSKFTGSNLNTQNPSK